MIVQGSPPLLIFTSHMLCNVENLKATQPATHDAPVLATVYFTMVVVDMEAAMTLLTGDDEDAMSLKKHDEKHERTGAKGLYPKRPGFMGYLRTCVYPTRG